MKIRLLVPRASASGPQNIGDEIDEDQATAIRMIKAGQAAPVRSGPEPEKAVKRNKVRRNENAG